MSARRSSIARQARRKGCRRCFKRDALTRKIHGDGAISLICDYCGAVTNLSPPEADS